MDGLALLGIILILYAVFVVYITAKKPVSIWDMAKIKLFRKALGEKGTVIFFYVFAIIAATAGIYFMIS